jgi:ABC-type hemin transport system ATPase subunit
VLATLTSLRIKNLALVEELDWQLAGGFVAVTGETGAGKSVIIGALKLLLGERAEKSLIRGPRRTPGGKRARALPGWAAHRQAHVHAGRRQSPIHQWVTHHFGGAQAIG